MVDRGKMTASDAASSPQKDTGARNDPVEQLQDRRVTALKRKREPVLYREQSSSVCTSIGTGSETVNTTNTATTRNASPKIQAGRSSLDSPDNSLGGKDEQFFLSPAVDLGRLKAVYCPVKGPVRMQTCWLPTNLTVSQAEYEDTRQDEEIPCVTKDLPQGSVDSRTVDMEDRIASSPEGSRGASPGPGSISSSLIVTKEGIQDASPNNEQMLAYDEEPIVVESYGGYRSAIGTHGCHQGTYVYEVKVGCDVLAKKGFGIRLGWATKGHELERILHQPVAAIHGDGYGFNVVNMGHDEGSIFYSLHKGVKKELPVAKSTRNVVKNGDVFGIVIHLGNKGRPFETTQDDIVLYRKTQQNHVKSPGPDWMAERKPQAGSYMELFWNGKSQGRAFQDEILESTYYPMVSLYTNLQCLPDGERDAEQRARVQVVFRSGGFAKRYPNGAKSLEHKVIW